MNEKDLKPEIEAKIGFFPEYIEDWPDLFYLGAINGF